MNSKPTVLSVAGFDPSGCAGLLADIKTFEAFNVYGIAVCTANTCQSDIEFTAPNWIPVEQILSQYHILQKRFHFDYVKIGIIENLKVLNTIIDLMRYDNKQLKIVWDPVLKASSGFEFHQSVSLPEIENICKKTYLITPNLEEVSMMLPDFKPEEAGGYLTAFCNVLIKGGHASGKESIDVLYSSDAINHFEGNRLTDYNKRGTGCVLSSAITAGLAKGESLPDACKAAKKYVTGYISSNHSLVGYHNYIQ